MNTLMTIDLATLPQHAKMGIVLYGFVGMLFPRIAFFGVMVFGTMLLLTH